VVLLGPQIRFQLPEMKIKGEKYKIPVEAIPSVDYGMCNGPKVLTFAINLINNNK
jgi:PTS system cellobiose-specific IIB component